MSDNNEIEIAKIEELFAQWDAAVETSNLDGYVDGLDENITLMPPGGCLLYTSPSPRDQRGSRMPSSA